MNTTMNNLIRVISPLLILSILLMSCSASQHAGKTYKKRPAAIETNGDVWYEYWQDQLDAREGKVIAPGSDSPEVARNAYDLAVSDRGKKEQTATLNTILTILGSIFVVSILVSALSVSAATSAASQN